MIEKLDWFPWYPERYRYKTLHLSAEQDGIYRRLIDHYMVTRQPLPDNDIALARIAGVDIGCFKQASSTIRAFFKCKRDGLLYHETCDTELDKQDKQAKFYSDRAKRGAKARHKKNNQNIDMGASSKGEAPLQPATITKTITKNIDTNVSIKALAPDWLPVDDWNDFIAMRKQKRAPMTERAKQLIIAKLDKFRLAGHSPAAVLQQSIASSWTDIYELKGNVNGTRQGQTQSPTGRDASFTGEQNGSGFGGRKSQTELYSEATERIIAKRNAEWEAKNSGQSGSAKPAIPLIAGNIRDA